MDLKQIKDLMAAMGRTGTKRLRIQKENFELELEREDPVSQTSAAAGEVVTYVQKAPPAAEVHAAPQRAHQDIPASLHPPVDHPEAEKEAPGTFIQSPMVGTFYTTPGPDEPPFTKVGDKVEKDTVVCIVEAMKVMNEVKAGVDGTIAEVLVENGHPVEFGTKLFRIT